MAAVQQLNPGRVVQGVIFFGYNNLDPRIVSWTRVVQSCILSESLAGLEQAEPRHPLVAVFKPLLADNEEALEREAGDFYRVIKYSALTAACKRALEEVFVSWLEQRLKHKQKQEIELMLLGELPDLEETQSGKDLIRIGEQRGLEKGLEKAILVFLEARHGTVPTAIQEKIATLTATNAERLLQLLPKRQTLDELAQWLAANQRDAGDT